MLVCGFAAAESNQDVVLCPDHDLEKLHESATPEWRFNAQHADEAMNFLAGYLELAKERPQDITERERIEVRNATMTLRGYALRIEQLTNPTEFGLKEFCRFLDEEAYRWH